ncbi:MAG: HAMP domain-containing protein, partial [Chitinophagaceae bacterium]|nr:HAMP domain-containing protein [Polaromonas sp.]
AAFIDRAERKILLRGALLLVLSLSIGVAVTLWLVWRVRQLRRYANAIERGSHPPVPHVPGELGELARAMDSMRAKLSGHQYIEGYVRALSHELKSPLAAIRGAGELLEGELPLDARREFAGHVLSQTAKLQALVDKMLALSKLEQRHTGLALKTVYWQTFLKPFSAEAGFLHAQLAMVIEVNPVHASVQADPDLLTLALSNLLENARSFAPVGSHITVHANGHSVSVRDTGPGAPDYALAKLGERFFSTTRPDGISKGSGLGLAIVRQIMALHGGSVLIENAAPGLRVTLQFAAPQTLAPRA